MTLGFPSALRGRNARAFSVHIAAIALGIAISATPSLTFADEDDPRSASRAPSTAAQRPGGGDRTAFHPSAFLPIPNLPIEDVDAVEVSTPANPGSPAHFVWPTEGAVHFFTAFGFPPAPAGTLPTLTPGVTGCDFVANAAGTYGVYQTLGAFYMYDLTTAPPSLAASGFLPGPVPQRRDIDPLVFADPLSVSGESAVFVTGTGLHCREIPTGAPRWDLFLPTVMVEAVDPVMSPNGNLWAPCVSSIAKIDPVAGVILSLFPNPSAPVREIDVQFTGAPMGPGAPAAWFPTNLFLSVYDDTPGGPGFPLAPPMPMPGAFIEGNDLQFNPTLTLGYIPTLPAMVQVSAPGLGISGVFGVAGFAHQRNQDAVFTGPTASAPAWAYAMQGAMLIAPDVPGGPPAFLPNPGVTYDGVDPAFGDTPPMGEIVSIATSAGTNVYNASLMIYLGMAPRTPGTGPLRTDVDHKPAPMFGSYIVQPAIGGLFAIAGFGPDDWLVTVANGVEVVDLAAVAVVEFMPYAALGAPGALTYRGGDAQPAFFSPGPMEPDYSVDNPDQDFVTKCWEYKYALNRWPYWYYHTLSPYYPAFLPYGVFGPPALVGWDILNHVKVTLLANHDVAVLDHRGNLLHQFPLPAPAIGGLIWDWDNKTCKIRCQGQLELVVNLTPLGYGQPPTLSVLALSGYTRWFPVVDRMNGWQFVIRRGGRELWVYDHLNPGLVSTFLLPARCIRRPVFDEQRKTLVVPLANRRVAFFNAHNYRIGLLPHQYLYYSPLLPAQVVSTPVFDYYNHYTLVQVLGNRLCVLRNDTGALAWSSPILPYQPVCPIQVDCYNKIAKGFFRNPLTAVYYEMQLDLYPMVFGGVPALQWITLGPAPYGYPVFDSMDGWEVYRFGNEIHVRNLFDPGTVLTAVTPLPIAGNLFIDRVNKYLVCALKGPNLFYMDLFRFTNGDPGAAVAIPLPYPATAQVTDDIVFLTQLRKAVVHVDVSPIQTELVALDLHSATPYTYPVLSGLPAINKQMYAHPFRGLVNWPWWSPTLLQGGEVTVDFTPTTWNPPQQPDVNVLTTSAPPIDAFDDTPPSGGFTVSQLPPQPGDGPTVAHFDVSGLEPGAMVFADVVGAAVETTEGTADDDGVCDDISVVLDGPRPVCFWQIDAAGNASPQVCQNVVPLDAPGPVLPERLQFSLLGGNPVRGPVRFAFALPAAGRVAVDVLDVAGRQVASLADGEFEAGPHEAMWDAGAVAPGVYFARLRSPFGELSERVVVIE
jgi:hypothetical protein